MTNSILSDEDFVRESIPIVIQTLANEFTNLSDQAKEYVQRQTLVACLNIRRKAKKQRLNLAMFVRRLAREQVSIWLATYGTPIQQATAMNQIMLQNRDAIANFLSPKRYRFRTNDIADEVLNDAFEVFFNNLIHQKSITSLISTSIIGIARNKALHQLRDERTGLAGKWVWLETTFVTVSDENIGSLDWPISNPEDDETFITLQLPNPESVKTTSVRFDLGRLRQWIADCFARLTSKRQLLVRLRYQFWTQQELKIFTKEEIETFFNDLGMADIAKLSGLPDSHTASVRLNESKIKLRNCLTEKLTTPAV